MNAQDEDRESPLRAAMAKSDNYDLASISIEPCADLSRAIHGKTPFHSIFNDTTGNVLMMGDESLDHVNPDVEGMSISHFVA